MKQLVVVAQVSKIIKIDTYGVYFNFLGLIKIIKYCVLALQQYNCCNWIVNVIK